MMKNVTVMKKVISTILLGSLLVTGAIVYADTLSDATASKGNASSTEQRIDRNAEMLTKMVTDGIITAEEKTTLEKAMETQRAAMDAKREAMKDTAATKPADGEKPEAGTKPASHFARMATDGLISQELADKVDAYMEAQRTAAFAAEVKPLVDAGTFKDTAAVKDAMTSVREAMQAEMDANKPSDADGKTKVDFSSLTDAEKTALKAEMDAKHTEMQAKHAAALTAVYSGLVSDGTLTQAQADALQDLMKNNEPGDRGPGHGPDGMDKPGEAPVKTTEVTQ